MRAIKPFNNDSVRFSCSFFLLAIHVLPPFLLLIILYTQWVYMSTSFEYFSKIIQKLWCNSWIGTRYSGLTDHDIMLKSSMICILRR